MLKMRKSLVVCALLCAAFPLATFAQNDAFTIGKIKIVGLARVMPGTVEHYLPVHQGQIFTDQKSIDIIQALYKTGFFSDVQLSREGTTLIVIVKERPTITSISFSGNSTITNKELLKALSSNDITEGAFFDSSKLHGIVIGLQQLYQQSGHNNALINVKIEQHDQNRIGLDIIINEGGVAKVRSVLIQGSERFSQGELIHELPMRPTPFWNFLSSANKYSQDGMDNDTQALTNFYLDHGYLDFRVVNQSATMSDDKKNVNVSFDVVEGKPYTISSIQIDNHSIIPSEKIRTLMKLQTGDIFSRSKIMDTNTAVGKALGDEGFAFPDISVVPSVNSGNHTVSLTLVVVPGNAMSVRFIHFSGNNLTEDNTLRHQLTFVEGAPYNQSKLDESSRLFNNFQFISNVSEKTVPVPGTKNQVDVNYDVSEISAGRAQIMGGYSDTEGFLYGVSLTEPNFKGQGKNVSLNLTKSQLADSVSLSYFNPFYTIHNVGRGFEVHYTSTNPQSVLNIASYDLDGFGGSVNYTVPMSTNLTFNYAFGYQQQRVTATAYTPLSIKYFIDPINYNTIGPGAHSPTYHETNTTAGLSYVNTDRFYFPTSGTNTSLSVKGGVPIMQPNLSYYLTNLSADWYLPLTRSHNWLMILHTADSYGNGFGSTKYFPFMYNSYSGGISTVPGFSPNTLGPRDRWGNALGGNESVAYGFDLVFPCHLGNKVRTSITVNGGNVYNQFISANPSYNPSGTPAATDGGTNASYSSSGPMRYSAGLRVAWQMPLLGTIEFAVAKAINPQPGDQTSWFNFNFGTSF